ncbi:MAG TPA: ion transporter [Verrucomicrobiae bacterium]|nr:ion transporter [Verrucomicrobiae bacterium]
MKQPPQTPPKTPEDRKLESARWRLSRNLHDMTDKAMIFLSLVWLLLVILEFSGSTNPHMEAFLYFIWIVFIVDFVVEFLIAPRKKKYLASQWLMAVSLLLPAFSIFRAFRAFRALRALRSARSVSLLRMITSVNRGMHSVKVTLRRRGIGYLVVITFLVALAAAAAILNFENPQSLAEAGKTGPGISTYGDALWWSAMILTTLGSEYWPKTLEGRILCFLLSAYAVGVFGYITASIASHFMGVDIGPQKKEEEKRAA